MVAEVEKNVDGKRVKVEGEDDGEEPKEYDLPPHHPPGTGL